MHLLLVEDDRSLGATLKERLEKEGYTLSWARSLAEARTAQLVRPPDLVILDVGLPDGSGFELAAEIRRHHATPFIFVTAQNSAEDRLNGYELGADEYIPKPFHLKELLLRVRRVLEVRTQPPAPPREPARRALEVAGRTIDLDAMAVGLTGGPTEYLAERDCRLLDVLIQASPRVVSRDEILDRVWGEGSFPSNRTVDNAIVRLRQALRDEAGTLIRSVRGVGYQWTAGEVPTSSASASATGNPPPH